MKCVLSAPKKSAQRRLWIFGLCRVQKPVRFEVWRDNIDESLLVVTARDVLRGALVGVGFVVGNRSHAQFVDLTVHRDYREEGIANRIGDEMLNYVAERNTKYIGLTYDKENSWLKDWYERRGFVQIDFAMWYGHKSSLDNM